MQTLQNKIPHNPRTCAFEKNKIHESEVLYFLKNLGDSPFFDLILVDPPYNIGKNFGNNIGNKTLQEYIIWSKKYLKECFKRLKESGLIYVYGFPEILSHLAVHFPIENQRWLAWHYTNKTVPTSKFWQRSYESILCLWKNQKPKLNIDAIREEYTDTFLKNAAGKIRNSKDCRYSKGKTKTIYKAHQNGALPRDVIKISALAGGAGAVERIFYCKTCKKLLMGKEKNEHQTHELIVHPTQKPLKLTEKLIKASNPSNILIPFAGTGSECFIAKKMNINFYACEINPDYVYLANQWLATL